MNPPKGSLAEWERLEDGLRGITLRFVEKKLRGRENIRGAKRQAIAEAAAKFHKDPRTIERYLEDAKPLRDPKTTGSMLTKIYERNNLETAKTLKASTGEPLRILAFIQQTLTPEDRADIFSFTDEVDHVYKIAVIKARAVAKSNAQKTRKVHDRK
jgi:hypothetical protein